MSKKLWVIVVMSQVSHNDGRKLLQRLSSTPYKGASCSPAEYIVAMLIFLRPLVKRIGGVKKVDLRWVIHFVQPILDLLEAKMARCVDLLGRFKISPFLTFQVLGRTLHQIHTPSIVLEVMILFPMLFRPLVRWAMLPENYNHS